MMYKALLFDFDGTFADTAHDLIGSANYIFDKYNKTNISYQEGRAVASDGSQAILKLRFDPLTPTIDKAVQEFLHHYQSNLLKKPLLFDGITKIIDLITKKNLKWGVVTNKPRQFTEKILSYHDLLDNIDTLICGDDGFKTKPAPDMLLEASLSMKIDPSNIAYIGDAHRDIVAANSANMMSILACYGYLKTTDKISSWGAKQIIQSPMELSEII